MAVPSVKNWTGEKLLIWKWRWFPGWKLHCTLQMHPVFWGTPQKAVLQMHHNMFPSNVSLSDLCYHQNKLNKTIVPSSTFFLRFQNLFSHFHRNKTTNFNQPLKKAKENRFCPEIANTPKVKHSFQTGSYLHFIWASGGNWSFILLAPAGTSSGRVGLILSLM